MTMPVLKSLRPDDWPDRINAGKAVVRFPNGTESGSWYSRPSDDDKTAEYIRRDPAVLAELPEVRALVADALYAAADKIDARGGLEQKDFGLSRATRNFYRARDLVRDFAAAIKEGRE